MPPSRETLRERFTATHGDHYTLRQELGVGASGFTFLAHDQRRRVPVCIKLYLDGQADPGAERDWRITSTIKHDQIADTFSVEHFDVGESAPAVAVVSRFITGQNLETVLQRAEALEGVQGRAALNEIVSRLAVRLCHAVLVLHDRGVGHGDLHERNIIVTQDARTDVFPRGGWSAVLIDFDNATFRRDPADGEQVRMESDVRALRRLVKMMTHGLEWHDEISGLLDASTSARDLGYGIGAALSFFGNADNVAPSHFDESHFNVTLRTLLAQRMTGVSYGAYLLEMIRRAALKVGTEPQFTAAQEKLHTRILTDPNYPAMSASMELRDAVFDRLVSGLID